MTRETQESREAAMDKAFRNLMNTVRSLGATPEEREDIIREIVTYGHHKEWFGWNVGFSKGYISGMNRERSYHV